MHYSPIAVQVQGHVNDVVLKYITLIYAYVIICCLHVVFMWKPEGERPLGRPRHRWENSIQINCKEIGWSVWTALVWLRFEMSGWRLGTW